MIRSNRLLWGAAVAVVASLLTAWLTAAPVSRKAQGLDAAVWQLGENLRSQLIAHRGLVGKVSDVAGAALAAGENRPPDPPSIVAAPFVDANFGESVAASKEVERLLSQQLVADGSLRMSPLTPASLWGADYVMFGILVLEDYGDGPQPQKRYHIVVSAVDHDTRRIAAQADVWLEDTNLDYTPSPLYRDSPVFPRDRRLASLVAIARSAVGVQADREYYDSLETNALMAEAERHFDEGDYRHALDLFRQVAARPDGQVMKAYLGLYRSSIKLDDMKGAETAFGKLVAVGAENDLSTKFLFRVNSTEFVSDRALQAQYHMWTRQIGQYFGKERRCIKIVGHCSRTGASAYNEQLSMERAASIQNLIVAGSAGAPVKAKAVGMGYRENIVGSGTDDARDALDRRVEVVAVDCQ